MGHYEADVFLITEKRREIENELHNYRIMLAKIASGEYEPSNGEKQRIEGQIADCKERLAEL